MICCFYISYSLYTTTDLIHISTATARHNQDFELLNGHTQRLSLSLFENARFEVSIQNDELFEHTECFLIGLTVQTAGVEIITPTATVFINDDDSKSTRKERDPSKTQT